MIKQSLFFISIIIGLSACASSPQSIRYYSLNLNSAQHPNSKSPSNQVRVVIAPIQLAKFLNQDNIVMQIGEHEVYKANFHRWAEPLDLSIRKLLIQKLNKHKKYQFVKSLHDAPVDSTLHLNIEIDQFHSTDNANVILSGHYLLYKKDKSFESIKSFNLSAPLTHDGYPHSVAQLKRLIGQLATQIIGTLKNQETNITNKNIHTSKS